MSNRLKGFSLKFEKTIPAPILEVWNAWTTEEGVKTFFTPECWIELNPGGAYEMYFNLDAEPGLRGGEGCRILAIEKPTMLSFTWNFPPDIPSLRDSNQQTHVTVRLSKVSPDSTLIGLHQDGWGEGDEWQEGIEYFKHAWGDIVLSRLQQRFTSGPISWNED